MEGPLSLLLLLLLVGLAAADDQEMILYFDADCPEGWEVYEEAQNRFILPNSVEEEVGQLGGSTDFVLTTNHFPQHHHKSVASIVDGTRLPLYPTNQVSSVYDNGNDQAISFRSRSGTANKGKTSDTGSGVPMSIAPPYIRLRACKKVDDNVTMPQLEEFNNALAAHIAEFDTMKQNINDIEADLAGRTENTGSSSNMKGELQGMKDDVFPYHVIIIVAFVFIVANLVIWLIATNRIKKLQDEVSQFKLTYTAPGGTDR